MKKRKSIEHRRSLSLLQICLRIPQNHVESVYDQIQSLSFHLDLHDLFVPWCPIIFIDWAANWTDHHQWNVENQKRFSGEIPLCQRFDRTARRADLATILCLQKMTSNRLLLLYSTPINTASMPERISPRKDRREHSEWESNRGCFVASITGRSHNRSSLQWQWSLR